MSEENLADPRPEDVIPAELETEQRLRVCVLREIVNTERDYVRTLDSLISVSALSCLSTSYTCTFRAKVGVRLIWGKE